MTGSLRAPQAAVFVAVLTCVAFLNSFGGFFVYDDVHEIQRNPAMERLAPLWNAMFVGNKLPARPLPYLTFAIDHALWGTRPFGYHITNLLVHVIAGLALFDLVRLTLLSPRLRGRWGDRAVPLAMVIAMIWAVHPLQTQAVTYVYQRIESMTGMFCLLALATFAEAVARNWSSRWLAASVAATAAAMASKENAVVLPLLILAYHWFFVTVDTGPDTLSAWSRGLWSRRWYYLLLVATWGILGLVLLSQQRRYQEFQELQHSPVGYLLTQSEVILHYLRLAILPIGQRFDYGSWPVAGSLRDVWPSFSAVAALVVATAVGTALRRPWAWLGVMFFLVLAPTSSIMPVEAVANEHRMYLALAPVVAGLVLAVTAAFDCFDLRRFEPAEASGPAPPMQRAMSGHRAAAITAGMVILLLVVATQIRNQAYATPTGIWLDVLRQDKENFRAYWMMASALDNEGDPEFATAMAEEAIRRHPKCTVLSELAKYHMSVGNPELAEYYTRFGYDLIRKLRPSHEKVVQGFTIDLATVLRKREEFAEMKELCEQVLTVKDQGHDLHPPVEIAAILLLADYEKIQGDLARADDLTTKALALARGSVPLVDSNALNAACLRADVLLQRGQGDEAKKILVEFVRALRAVPRRSPEQEHFLNLFLKMLRDSGNV
jgi:hypothetical protein